MSLQSGSSGHVRWAHWSDFSSEEQTVIELAGRFPGLSGIPIGSWSAYPLAHGQLKTRSQSDTSVSTLSTAYIVFCTGSFFVGAARPSGSRAGSFALLLQ